MIKLIAFLGNFGQKYAQTRHNVAWQFAENLPFYEKISWQQKFKGDFSSIETRVLANYFEQSALLPQKTESLDFESLAEKILFLKPLTYMNLSGESICECAHFFKIKPDEILVVHDELELPLGTASLKFGGGLGGHNGLRSAKASLGTADFFRLRFGLTKPQNRDIADYVLSDFSSDEKIVLKIVFEECSKLFAKLIFSKNPANLIPAWSKKKIAEIQKEEK